MRIVVPDGDQPGDNAMPITDYITGEAHLLYQIDYACCYHMKSVVDSKRERVDFESIAFAMHRIGEG